MRNTNSTSPKTQVFPASPRRVFRRQCAQNLFTPPATTQSTTAKNEERYLRFLERLEETRRMIAEQVSDLNYEAAQLLPMKKLAERNQIANAVKMLGSWITDEITSPLPRGRDGLLRRDRDSPLWLLMTMMDDARRR